MANSSTADRNARFSWLAFGVLCAALVWNYRDVLIPVVGSWRTPLYAHGWLILVLAAIVAWRRRRTDQELNTSDRWNGVLLLACTLGFRLLLASRGLLYLESLTFLLALGSAVLVAGGWGRLRRMLPALVTLACLFPLPASVESSVLGTLQTLAIALTTFVLQTLGLEIYREGHTIFVAELPAGLVDLCGRLQSTLIVVGLGVTMGYASRWSSWERWIIILSAIPAVLTANVVRISASVVIYWQAGQKSADFFTDVLGAWIVVGLSFGLLFVESIVLRHLFRQGGSSGETRFQSTKFASS